LNSTKIYIEEVICMDIVNDFFYKVSNLLYDKKISKHKMLTDLGLSRNSFVDWKKNNNLPRGDVLIKMANYLNVSVDYLLGLDKKTSPSFPSDELIEEAIHLFRKMSLDEQKALLQFLKAMYPSRNRSK